MTDMNKIRDHDKPSQYSYVVMIQAIRNGSLDEVLRQIKDGADVHYEQGYALKMALKHSRNVASDPIVKAVCDNMFGEGCVEKLVLLANLGLDVTETVKLARDTLLLSAQPHPAALELPTTLD